MKPRTLLILLVLVLGLGAFIQFYERKLPSTEEREKAGDRIFGVEKDDVTAIEIDRAGQTIRLEKVPAPAAGWRLTKPLAARADGTAVAGLVESLAGLARTRTLEKADPRDVGLDHPQTTVKVTAGKKTQVLEIGAKVPTGSEVIVGLDGERNAYVTSDAILSTLEKAPGEWRDRQMFAGDREKVDRITLTGPAGTTVLARKGEGFEIENASGLGAKGAKDRADRDLVDGLLTDLTGLHAQQFLDDAKETPAALGLLPPRGTVEVAVRGAAPQRIEIGAPAPTTPPAPGAPPEASPAAPNVYARMGSQTFVAATNLAADVARPAADWRSRALSRFQVYQVESARIDDPSGTLTVTRSGTDWKRGKDTISYTPVSDLLFEVAGGKASRLLTPEEAKAALAQKPRVTVTLTGEKGGGQETLAFYPPGSEGTAVKVSDRDALLLLPGDKMAEVEKQIAAIRSAAPLPPEKPVATGKAEKK